jgi:hypothetical protein
MESLSECNGAWLKNLTAECQPALIKISLE